MKNISEKADEVIIEEIEKREKKQDLYVLKESLRNININLGEVIEIVEARFYEDYQCIKIKNDINILKKYGFKFKKELNNIKLDLNSSIMDVDETHKKDFDNLCVERIVFMKKMLETIISELPSLSSSFISRDLPIREKQKLQEGVLNIIKRKLRSCLLELKKHEGKDRKSKSKRLVIVLFAILVLVPLFNIILNDYRPITYEKYASKYMFVEEKGIQKEVELLFKKVVTNNEFKKEYIYTLTIEGNREDFVLNENQYIAIGDIGSFIASIDRYKCLKKTNEKDGFELQAEEINYKIPVLDIEKSTDIAKWKKDFLNEEYKEYKEYKRHSAENAIMGVVGVMLMLFSIFMISLIT